ncbi:hypothetical protein AAC387_Pa03g1536 [Persea americana]
MTTNKDRIEQLESELQELKVSVQNMAGMEASIREVKDMLSKSHEKTSSFGSKDSNENVAFSGGGLSSSLPCPTKPGFPSYSGDDPTVWLDRVAQYFDYQHIPAD